MKLYEVPNYTRVRLLGDLKDPPCAPTTSVGQELNFKKIDGMYSYCVTDAGEVVHPAAWTEVEIVETENSS
jgi:hypothetical protein